jgi:uncharacterized damage-inducible protein DinB
MGDVAMTDIPPGLRVIYAGWHTYQDLLLPALTGLTAESLALSAAPGLRTIGGTASHMIGARARWFHQVLGEGGEAFAAFGTWDRPGQPVCTAAELVAGLTATWEGMQSAILRWTPVEWAQTYPGNSGWGTPDPIVRDWVIWHLIEHDLHHGGEISLLLGMHGLPAPDL